MNAVNFMDWKNTPILRIVPPRMRMTMARGDNVAFRWGEFL